MNYSRWSTIRRGFSNFRLREQLELARDQYENLETRDGVINPKVQVISPTHVSQELACLAHSEEYVNKFFHGETSSEEQRRTGFIWTHGLCSRVRYETGGTLMSAMVSLTRGLSCSTGGGTHHAGPDYGSGFCLLNDLAVTAETLLRLGLVQKVLIVDLDVHQGDGTALIFSKNPEVFTFSMHCQSNFPFRKNASDLDIGLEDHVGDSEYLAVLDETLPHLLDTLRPDLVLYDAGVDPHVKDDLGKLDLTDEGLWRRDELVVRNCIRRGIPVSTVIGGGYDRNIEILAARHSIVHRVCTKVWRESNLVF
ncbi:uncharacterized protein LOC111703059 isoform X2 [Eurytemora carolleeae]|uniref:uncharacterized protein LOC111703059 isoform X2 n=1 Tax=Eurytemora carolleeae TaxID=1294199 RepID=UPI000C794142|nr:uncharacterized protein LOC111703059 isoform X2 [Eurytemora carolleeae]|eukprot:XP_023330680.1 uncharacterized protein LOC111703059 isoform X2 [Eurytemora affinis]